jgi:hypothetical protein
VQEGRLTLVGAPVAALGAADGVGAA